MTERDSDFFKLYYRQWRRRMHIDRVPYDLQGALLAIVIDTHLTGSPPVDDDLVLAGCMMVTPRKARAAVNRLLERGLVTVEGGLIVNRTAVEDVREREDLRQKRSTAGREGGARSPKKGGDESSAREKPEPKPLKTGDLAEAKSGTSANLLKAEERRGEERRDLDDDDERRPSLFVRVLAVAGLDRRGSLPKWWMPPGAELEVNRWRDELGLSEAEILGIIRESRKQHSEPPGGPRAFDRDMRRNADIKARGGESHVKPIANGRAGGLGITSEERRRAFELGERLREGRGRGARSPRAGDRA